MVKKLWTQIGSIGNNVWFGLKISFLASRKYFFLKCLILLSTTLLPLTTIWLWKEILNRVIGGDVQTVICYLVCYLLLTLVTYLLAKVNQYISNRYNDELLFYIDGVMIEKVSRMDLSFFDSASMGDKVRQTRSNFGEMMNITWMIFGILSDCINVLAALIIVTTYRWWIGLATVLLLIPYMRYNKKYSERRYQLAKQQQRDQRRMNYYNGVFFDTNIQFEMKLNHTGSYFIQKYHEAWLKLYRINKREDIRYNSINAGLSILNILSELLVMAISVVDVYAGHIGVGDLQYNLSMVSRLREQIRALMAGINDFMMENTMLNEMQEFVSMKPEYEKSGSRIPSANPRVEFEHVSFRYPGTEQYVLKDCSFTIEPHEKVGLIGLNGAGKTTIVKLLFRFYDPESGCIKLDGVDLKEYDIYAVRGIFGVLFQDYVRYSLPLREIIALSDFEQRYNEEKLRAVCDLTGVSDIIKDWEDGFDSVLGRNYVDNGKDLSGGQWQLVSLARAYFKDCDYMILDEPSAALDPVSEDRIFEQLYRLSEGKSAVTISHRLSNTTLADRLLILGDGHIIEQGPHEELLKQNGEYARLFRLQASKYMG